MTEQLNSLCEKYNELLDTQDMQGQEKLEIERLEERVKTLQTDRQELVLKIEDLEVKVKEITKSKTDVELKYEHVSLPHFTPLFLPESLMNKFTLVHVYGPSTWF